jgi:hypothetical protein
MVIEGTHYSPNCSCKNCKRIKIMDKKASLQKESEWEKEFDKKFWIYFVQYYPEKENGLFGSIKSFIYQTIANREKEIAEEVKKAYQKKSSQLHGGYDDADYLNAYGMAIHDVLQIIKH